MGHIEENLTCIAAGCANASVALVPVVVAPGETDPRAIADAPTKPVCGEHVDLLWDQYSAFGAKALLNFVTSETTSAAIQKIAVTLSTHNHPDSKAKAGLIAAAVTDGTVLRAC